MIISKRKFRKFKASRAPKLAKKNAAIIAVVVLAIGGFLWYNLQLSPVGGDTSQLIKVNITAGSSPQEIGINLKNSKVIRSVTAFDIYTRLSGRRNNLQAGVYRLSPSESTRQIVAHLVNGSVDTFNITFYPGATLTDSTDATESEKDDTTTMLLRAGYTQAEIDYALSAQYDSPLFAGKPAGTGLEGYIYGETYNFNAGASVGDILKRTFDEFYAEVQKDDLVAKFASHGLNLYQGITMASIIQREVSNPEDQKVVAQIFYSRLSEGMKLESDVTYQYICDKLGVQRDVKYDSPYNTRLYSGLPIGPISSPGRSALQAVADPATSSYLYFLSGDDDLTYFAYTNDEHDQNRTDHCTIKCATP